MVGSTVHTLWVGDQRCTTVVWMNDSTLACQLLEPEYVVGQYHVAVTLSYGNRDATSSAK